MARCGFGVSLSSSVRSNLNSLLIVSRGARNFLLPFVLLCATLGLAQGTGVQPTEATNGEVSLDTLNVHIDIPIVRKAGVGLPFSYSLPLNTNIWVPGQNNTWQLSTPIGFWISPELPLRMAGSFLLRNTLCNGNNYLTFYGFVDANGNLHSFTPVVMGNGGIQGICTIYKSANVLIPDGSGITANLLNTGAGTATYPDGTVVSPASFSTSGTITDVNGNKITTSDAPTWPATAADTLGVTELTQTSGCNSSSLTTTFTYPTSTGSASVTVTCTKETLQTNFGCPSVTDAPGSTYYLPTSISLPDGSAYTLTYESQVSGTTTGRLASIIYPTGEVVSYQYTGPNNGVNCADGSTAGLARTVSGDAVYQYTRNTSTWLTTTLVNDYGVGHSNDTSVYTFIQGNAGIFLSQSVENQGSSTPLRTTVYCYNGNQTSCATAAAPAFPLTQTDVYTTLAGTGTSSRVSTTFDSYMNVTKRAVYDFGASTPTRTITSYNFGQSDVSGTCVAIGNGVNSVPCYTQMYDGSGHLLRASDFVYDVKGNLLTRHDYTNTNTYTYLTTSHTYNTNGTVATSTDPNGNVATFTYGVCNSGMPTKVTLPNGLNTQIGWDSGCKGAVPVSITDPAGNTVSATYSDPFWRPTSKTDQLSNTVNLSYYPTVPINTSEAQITFGPTPSDFDVFNTADALGRPLYAQQIEGPNGSWDTTQMGYSWNTTGRVTTKTMPCATTKGAGCSTPTTTATHDALGRTLVVTDGGGGTITNTYTKQDVLTVLGPAPTGEVVKQVQKEYNGLGQLVSVCQLSSATGTTSCGQANGGTGYLTTYSYNADGTVSSVVRGAQTHSFTYDAIGRTLTATYPESGTTTYVYDGTSCWSTPTKGLLTYKTDAAGNTIMYSYDSLNRMIVKRSYGPNSDGYFSIYVYDSATVGGSPMQNTAGRLAEQVTGYGPSCTTVATCLGSMTRVTDEGFSYTARGEMSDVYESTPNSGGYYHTNATYSANGALVY